MVPNSRTTSTTCDECCVVSVGTGCLHTRRRAWQHTKPRHLSFREFQPVSRTEYGVLRVEIVVGFRPWPRLRGSHGIKHLPRRQRLLLLRRFVNVHGREVFQIWHRDNFCDSSSGAAGNLMVFTGCLTEWHPGLQEPDGGLRDLSHGRTRRKDSCALLQLRPRLLYVAHHENRRLLLEASSKSS
eukprot:scaffold7589_cov286-Pinguiococcus_pyrenoidosus.AAC.2